MNILRGSQDYTQEILALKNVSKTNEDREKVKLWKEFLKVDSLKPLLIIVAFWSFHQFSGIYAVVFYAVDIFEGKEN